VQRSRQEILAEIMGQLDPDFTTIGVPDEWVKGPKWYGPGEAVTVRGFTIPDGMVYVGKTTGARNHHAEPSLIDPSLAIETGPILDRGPHLEYWMAYSSFQPEHRGAYLQWLADGRPGGRVPDAFPLLFLYGLERRVFVDLAGVPADDPELAAIRATLAEMLAHPAGRRYGGFNHHAEGLVDFIDLRNDLAAGRPLPPPNLRSDRWQNRLRAQIELGRYVARGEGIPAHLALAWALFHFDYSPRTAAIRCQDEVHRMFAILFDRAFPKGLIAKPGKTRLNATQSCANPALRYRPMQLPDLPDVFALRNPIKRIYQVYETATNELGAYSRWLSRYPESAGTLQAIAQLPPELIDPDALAVQPLIAWATRTLGTKELAEFSGAELIALWDAAKPASLTVAASTALLRLLGGLGFGVAPDVRIVAPPVSAKAEYILFRLPPEGDCPVSDAYLSAETVVQAVTAAWQTVPGKDLSRIIERSNAISPLEPADRIRLRAFQRVVAAPGVKLNGLKRRIDQLTYPPERERIVDTIVRILTADGAVAPSEVAVLTKVFQLFGLDPAEVSAKLHGQLTAGPSRRTSRSATLDPELVRHKQRETDRVGALLGTIFAEEEAPAPVPVVRGLDPAHAQLLQDLRTKPSWSRTEFSQLAAKYRLLPDGAIDTLNEAALDTVGEYLFDSDDPLVLNEAVLKDLLA
jgi:hypothetical protein